VAASDQIRNIIQTHSLRTIIKQAPDLVVYIDDLPYLINNWTPNGETIVNFNDYVTASGGAADIGTFIPSATVNLSIPNDSRALFLAPGGNTAFYTMAEIKIFAKGYYMTTDGQSVYERVFWGVISSITQVESETSLEVTLTCKGILHLLDLMQINLNPSAMTSVQGGPEVSPFATVHPALNPILWIRDMFATSLGDDIGNVNTLDALTVANTQLGGSNATVASVSKLYVSKWVAHLKNMNKGVRLFGLKQDVSDYDIKPLSPDKDASVKSNTKKEAITQKNTQSEADVVADAVGGYNTALVQGFTPSFQMGNITLMESSISSRLARVQAMVDLMGWEGYQDIDGSIIIKPPLYNLNPLNTSTTSSTDRNPFVINLDEKKGSDSLVEDEAQVRLTRVAVKGTLNASDGIQIPDGDQSYLPVGVFYDPILIRQFGLRTEGVKQIQYIGQHSMLLYAYAASELTKTIKNWKTYTVTIPMRPELRLGFPIHIPWRDIMGYLENISWTYTRGGSADMTLTCSMIRTREMYGQKNDKGKFVYTPVKNAILRWCAPGSGAVAAPNSVIDSLATLPTPLQAQRTTLQRNFETQTALVANVTGDPPNLPGNAWVVQNDVGLLPGDPVAPASYFAHSGAAVTPTAFAGKFAGDFFVTAKPVDAFYCLAVQTYAMPYTDDMGYTLARPFPWGRYSTLEQALDTFTRPMKAPTGAILPFEMGVVSGSSSKASALDGFLQSSTDAFLLTGLGTPSVANGTSSTDPSSNSVITQLAGLAIAMSDNVTCFVVSYPSAEDPNASGLSPNPFNATQQAAVTAASTATPGLTEMNATNAAAYGASMVSPPATPASGTGGLF